MPSENERTHIIALSGGKDSTAMAVRLAEKEPRDYQYICTPTGDELPEMEAHWRRLEAHLGKPIKYIGDDTLEELIYEWQMVPNFRARWCTRVLKIEPFQAYVSDNTPCTIYVGLRADEESRAGVEYRSDLVKQRFPLREWGWGLKRVREYLAICGISIPRRTDCACCFWQTLGEWYELWLYHPERYERVVQWEKFAGHTLRSPQRDTRPAALDDLRKEFVAGYVPKKRGGMKERKTMCSTCAR